MRFLSNGICATLFGYVVAVLLAACGGSQPPELAPNLTAPSAAGRAELEKARGQGNGGDVALWVTNPDYNYLIGTNLKGNKTVSAIHVSDNGCTEPLTVHSDVHGNAWTACFVGPNSEGPAEQEYSKTGSLVATYNVTAQGCPASSQCSAYGFDGGVSGRDVFVEQSEAYITDCAGSCSDKYLPAGVSRMTSPSATPTFISLGSFGKPAYFMYYMALDGNGNIWFDYYGSSNSQCCYGVGEIAGATGNNPTVKFILVPGTLQWPGGIEIANNTAYITDPKTRLTYAYSLPITPSSMPNATYGPTPENKDGCGAPSSGGFNKAGSVLALADGCGWLDLTTIPGNANSVVHNNDFAPSLGGAAYVNSARP